MTAELLVDLSEVREVGLKGLHHTLLALVALVPSQAWAATVRSLAWGVADELQRRRMGGVAAPVRIDWTASNDLTADERSSLAGQFEAWAAAFRKDKPLVGALRLMCDAVAGPPEACQA